MNWCFALINNKLSELFFERHDDEEIEFLGHCDVQEEEYTTKKEKQWIEKDTKHNQFTYRKGKYTRINIP